jgi:hypothetical protein
MTPTETRAAIECWKHALDHLRDALRMLDPDADDGPYTLISAAAGALEKKIIAHGGTP